MIPFNKPYLSGKELEYMRLAVESGKISGNGEFTRRCEQIFEQRYGFKRAMLTTSCTHALEMCALLLNIKAGDEVIMPSFTYVSAANAFVLRGATLVFADSCEEHPNIDADKLEDLVTPNTKAIVVTHYAGTACNMDKVMELANKHNLYVVEDAAHSIDSYYKGRPLGSIGNLATFSFHETKNIISGEGGLLVVNDERLIERAEIIREKGTNRSAFYKQQVSKYEWVDLGSSYIPSELTAAFLLAQLESCNAIQQKRKKLWNLYFDLLKVLPEKGIQLPWHPAYATNNAHIFYVVCKNPDQRHQLIRHMEAKGIHAVFHYQSLHRSEYYLKTHGFHQVLPQCERYSECLVRLPLFYELEEEQVRFISETALAIPTY